MSPGLNLYARLLRYVRPYWWAFAIAFAGMVVVADGTPEAAKRLERVLTSDPGMGVVRHADAGYEEAIACAKERGVHIPHG